MMKLLLFETKKFFKNTKNIVLIALMFMFVIIVCLQNAYQLASEREEIYKNDSYIYLQLMSSIEDYEEEFPDLLPNFQAAMTALDNKLKHATTNEWRTSLEQATIFIDNLAIIQETITLGYIEADYQQIKKENTFYLKHNIKPDNSLYGVSAMYYVRLVLSICFSIYGYLFFLLLFYDIFSREVENKNKNWLLTLPLPYNRFSKMKLILATSIVFGLFACLVLTVFSLGWLLSRSVGSVQYPMAILSVGKGTESLPFSLYFGISFLMFVFAVYALLLLLLSVAKVKLESEKVLLIGVIGYIAISQFTKLLNVYPMYFLVVGYINLHESVIEFFKRKLLTANYLTMGASLFLLMLLTVYTVGRKEK